MYFYVQLFYHLEFGIYVARSRVRCLMILKCTVIALFPSPCSKCCFVLFLCLNKHILKSSTIKQPLIPLAVPLISTEQICPSLLFPVNKHLHPVDTPSRSNPLLSLIGPDVTDGAVQGRVGRRCSKTNINIQKLFVCLVFPSSVAGFKFK